MAACNHEFPLSSEFVRNIQCLKCDFVCTEHFMQCCAFTGWCESICHNCNYLCPTHNVNRFGRCPESKHGYNSSGFEKTSASSCVHPIIQQIKFDEQPDIGFWTCTDCDIVWFSHSFDEDTKQCKLCNTYLKDVCPHYWFSDDDHKCKDCGHTNQ